MGKLTLEVMSLRQIQTAGFTRKDLQATASVLRELIASERELQKQAETALAAERQALLKASPEDPLPKSAASALAEAAQAHGQRMGRLLERLSSAIGDAKAMAIRQVLGIVPVSMGRGMAPWSRGSDGQPAMRGQRGPGGSASDDAGAKPAQPTGTGGGPPRSAGLQGPFGKPGQEPGMFQPPGMGGGPWGQFGMMPFMGPHLTTSELLDLIEEKLGAMRQ